MVVKRIIVSCLSRRKSVVAVIADRTATTYSITIEQNIVKNSCAIRFNRLDFLNAPKLNPLERDE